MRAHAPMNEIPEPTIRERAYHIWEREGRPEGRAEDHWQMARTELTTEPTPGVAMESNPAADREVVDHPEPVEPLEAVENQGSFPGLADQDEESPHPRRLAKAKAKAKRGGREDRSDLPPR